MSTLDKAIQTCDGISFDSVYKRFESKANKIMNDAKKQNDPKKVNELSIDLRDEFTKAMDDLNAVINSYNNVYSKTRSDISSAFNKLNKELISMFR